MKILYGIILLLLPLFCLAQPTVQQIQINENNLPAGARSVIRPINLNNADIKGVLRSIASEARLNLSIQYDLTQRVTGSYANIGALEAIIQLCLANGLRLRQEGSVLRVEKMPDYVPPPSPEREPDIRYENGRLSWDLKGESIQAVCRKLSQVSGRNVAVVSGLNTTITGYNNNVEFETGLQTIANLNGLRLRNQGSVFIFDSSPSTVNQGSGYAVNPYDRVPNERNQETTPVSSEQLSKLIKLKSAQAEAVESLIPERLKNGLHIALVKEQNGFIVVGSTTQIQSIEAFIAEIDLPSPQILLEALAVDFRVSNVDTRGLSFGRGAAQDTSALSGNYWHFGLPDGSSDGTVVQGSGEEIRRVADIWRAFLGISVGGTLGQLTQTIGRLPKDFYIRLQYLLQSGNAEIRSRPQIATLNGHEAKISIGETQYYLLNTSNYSPYTPYGTGTNQNQGSNGTSSQTVLNPYTSTQRFEQIEAKVSLSITPWVGSNGEVTATIKPEFSTPVGKFNPQVPPTISSRVIESTVRLRDGETIILGGLITEVEEVNENKIPVLHKIPLIGRLFRSRKIEKSKQELIIFVTPHIFYGDERDAEKWELLKGRTEVNVSPVVNKEGTVLPIPPISD